MTATPPISDQGRLLAALERRARESALVEQRRILARLQEVALRREQALATPGAALPPAWDSLLRSLEDEAPLQTAALSAHLREVDPSSRVRSTERPHQADDVERAYEVQADDAETEAAEAIDFDPDLDTAQYLEAEAKFGLLDTDEVDVLHRLEEGPLDSPNSTSTRARVEAIVEDVEEASEESEPAHRYGYGYGYRRDDARLRGVVESPVLDDDPRW